MKLHELLIRRMPGFEDKGFELPDLSEGLNVIVGSNASGKTTICKAIKALLWGELRQELSPLSLVGVWRDGEDLVRLEREGEKTTCQRNGADAQMPPLPGSHLAQCFTITVDDLFHDDNLTNRELADLVAQEMAGGYDLNAVRKMDSFKISNRHGRGESRALQAAETEVKEIQSAQQGLRTEEQALNQFKKQLEEAYGAEARLATLRDARELISVHAGIEEEQNALAGFPEGMLLLRGHERDSLLQILNDLRGFEKKLKEASDSAEEARSQESDAALPKAGIDDTQLAEQKALMDGLRNTERDLGDAECKAGEANEKIKTVLRTLGDAATPEKLDAIDTTGLDEIEAFHREATELHGRRVKLEANLRPFAEEMPRSNREALSTGVHILNQWLESSSSGQTASRGFIILNWCVIGALAVTAAALAVFVSTGWMLLMLPAAVAAMAALFLRKPAIADFRDNLEEQFARTTLDPPDAWDRERVRQHLTTLGNQLAQERELEKRHADKQELAQLHEAAKGIERRRAELVGRFGVSPDTSNLALLAIADNLRRYQEASTSLNIADRRIASLRGIHTQQLQAINDFLARFGEQPCTASEPAQIRTDAIAKRAAQHRAARMQLAQAKREAADARDDIDERNRRKQKLFADCGLADDAARELEDRLERLPAYKQLKDNLAGLRLQEHSTLKKLQCEPEMLELTVEQIDKKSARLKEMADSRESLSGRIANIEQQIASVCKRNSLEQALAVADGAKAQLTEHRDEAALAATANFLLDDVETRHRAESQPRVLRAADQLLATFTQGRYALQLDQKAEKNGAAFRAFDTTTRRGLALSELSRGTCMQLLLAVRLAVASDAEQQTQLPFILDEVLSSSDPARFKAVTKCLLRLVKQGRQVFYFTCQPGDAAAWHKVAAELGVERLRMLDLDEIRNQMPMASGLLTESAIEIAPPPAPGNMTLCEYANHVGTPPMDPMAGANATHVAHLVDGADQLHRLLQADIRLYGQVATLARHDRIDSHIKEGEFLRMQARARIVDAFAEARRIGRSRPLARETLSNAGVTPSWIERVVELARALDWDAARLVAALETRNDARAKGFREKALESLTECLIQSGHLDQRDSLDKEAVRSSVLAAANDDIEAGTIRTAEIDQLLENLWRLATS